MHWTSLGWVHGGTVEVKMDLYQPREAIAKFGGRAMGVRTRMHIFSDSGGIQNSPGAWGYFFYCQESGVQLLLSPLALSLVPVLY